MSRKNILVVEDEQVIQILCHRLLDRPPYDLALVGSVREAAGLIKDGPLDLLITDLRLPDGDGVEVIHHARQLHPDCKIIIITGSPTPEERFKKIQALPVTEYISKPFEVDIFVSAVRRALGE